MSQFAMDMLYTHLDHGESMRQIKAALRERIVNEYYQPHHTELTNATEELLSAQDSVTIVDCHSFPDTPLNRSLNTRVPRPDFNIGTDQFHTPQNFIDASVSFFAEAGYTLGMNWPYNGTIVPFKYYQKDRRSKALCSKLTEAVSASIERYEVIILFGD